MPTVEKLQHSLQQSQKWTASFKQEIKKLMQEITSKNQLISKISRWNIDTRDQIQRSQAELKALLQEKQKASYKRDKLQIKVDQLEGRIRVYQEGANKKIEWNKQLKNKITNIQKEIDQQNNTNAIDQIFQAVSQSKISISSINSHSDIKSQKSSKSSNIHPLIDTNLSRLIKLEKEYHQLNSRCKQKSQQLQRQKKKEVKLKQTLQQITSQLGQDDKQNIQRQSNPTEEISKQTRTQLKRIKDLQERSSMLTSSLQNERAWINKYAKHVEAIAQLQTQTEGIRMEILSADREVKKQRKAIETICSYILKESS